jgi:hypothetical protein
MPFSEDIFTQVKKIDFVMIERVVLYWIVIGYTNLNIADLQHNGQRKAFSLRTQKNAIAQYAEWSDHFSVRRNPIVLIGNRRVFF